MLRATVHLRESKTKEMNTALNLSDYTVKRGSLVPKANKYGRSKAADRTYAGVVYDSKAEMQFAMALDLRLKCRDIMCWGRQIEFPMVVAGKKICKLVIDFELTNFDGSVEYFEVKGFETPAYRLKYKLFKALYPDVKFTVVKK